MTDTEHSWHLRDGWKVCSLCGVVCNRDTVIKCRGFLPRVETRGEVIASSVPNFPTGPQAIAERCWAEAMAWLFREAYIVRPEVSELRELYTGVVNGTLSGEERGERIQRLIWKEYMSTPEDHYGFDPIKDYQAVGTLRVIARGKP